MSFVPANPVFTVEQVERLSNIFDNAGQVALGAFVFSQLVVGFDNTNVVVLLFGIGTVLLCWIMSVALARKRKADYEI